MSARRYVFGLLIVLLAILSNCRPIETAELPTLAVLPSLTFTSVPSATLVPTHTSTSTLTPSDTATPDLIGTRRADISTSNAIGEMTLLALWTSMAPTFTPTHTYTPSLTITMTRTPLPSLTPLPTSTRLPTQPPVHAMTQTMYYVISTANLRACPRRECDRVAQLQYGATVMANGTVDGEMVNSGNRLWYRVNYQGENSFIYSALVARNLPTAVPPTQLPIYVPPVSTLPPLYSTQIYSPPTGGGSGGCPDMGANCSQLSCAEAYACLRAGNRSLDRDHDGIPCESQCGG